MRGFAFPIELSLSQPVTFLASTLLIPSSIPLLGGEGVAGGAELPPGAKAQHLNAESQISLAEGAASSV